MVVLPPVHICALRVLSAEGDGYTIIDAVTESFDVTESVTPFGNVVHMVIVVLPDVKL